MKNAGFGKILENMRKQRDVKLVAKEKRRNCLVLEVNSGNTKCFTENLLAIEMKKLKYFQRNLSIWDFKQQN